MDQRNTRLGGGGQSKAHWGEVCFEREILRDVSLKSIKGLTKDIITYIIYLSTFMNLKTPGAQAAPGG